MPKNREQYPPQYRRQMVELAHSGRSRRRWRASSRIPSVLRSVANQNISALRSSTAMPRSQSTIPTCDDFHIRRGAAHDNETPRT